MIVLLVTEGILGVEMLNMSTNGVVMSLFAITLIRYLCMVTANPLMLSTAAQSVPIHVHPKCTTHVHPKCTTHVRAKCTSADFP